jgi:hypothetical protein
MKALTQRFVGTLLSGLALLAILAGGAQAVHPNDRPGMLGIRGGTSAKAASPDWFERAALRDAPAARPDDRAGVRGVPQPPAASAQRVVIVGCPSTLGAWASGQAPRSS